MPPIKPGDWISIGVRDCVVTKIYPDKALADLEVVYLDDLEKAINDDVVWRNDKWEFKHSGPSGGYADKYGHLAEHVQKLRRGRFWQSGAA